MRWLYPWGLGLCVLAGSGCGETASEGPRASAPTHVIEVRAVPVARAAIESSLELTGTLFPWKFATIASEVTGVIERIAESEEKLEYEIDGQLHTTVLPLDIGHRVRQGDLLIEVNSTEARCALELAQAKQKAVEAELAHLLAWKRAEEITQLRAQCDECAAVLVEAQAGLKRAESLAARSATSQKEVDEATRALAAAQAAQKRSEAALQLAEAGPTAEQVAMARAQLELAKADADLKQQMVDKCTIRCPLENAWIVERFVGVGDHVTANPSTALLRVVDSSILLAQINVPERYQGLVQLNSRAKVVADGGRGAALQANEVEALVVLVNAQVDPDTRSFRVRVGLDNTRNLFKAGTFAKVIIPLRSEPDALIVPADSITFSKGEPAAFVVRDGIVERIPVTLGISNRTHYQVLSGLSEKDVVVQGDLSLLAPGLRVKVQAPVAKTAAAIDGHSTAAHARG